MITSLARNFRPRLLLATSLVLTLSTGMLAQNPDQMILDQPNVDPSFNSSTQSAGQNDTPLAPQDLDDLLGPIALYPDPLLAQVLAAATYPMDIVQAARFLNSSSDLSELEQMGLDPSVQALARFPDTLRMMDEQLDWTNALGAAFLNQQQDVMDAVQRLRALAVSHGALRDTPQQEIYVEESFVGILPADPEIIYVPTYVPEVVYGWSDPPFDTYYSSISFGVGFSTGSWFDLGFNWGGGCLAYRPWPLYHGGFYGGGFFGGRGFGSYYYGRGGWGGAWNRRFGPSLPRFRGGLSGFRGGRGFSSLRGGFGNRSGGGFASGSGGRRGGFGNNPRGGSGGGFGSGFRDGQGRRGPNSGFGSSPRSGSRVGGFDRNGSSGITRNSPRGNSGNAAFNGGTRNNFGAGNKSTFGAPGNSQQSGRRDNRSQDVMRNGTDRRGGSTAFDRSPREGARNSSPGTVRQTPGGNRGGLYDGGRSNRDGNRSGLQSGRSPRQSGGYMGNAFGGSRPGGASGSPRTSGRGSLYGGRTSSPESSYRSPGVSRSSPRGFGRSESRGPGGSPGFSRSERSSGGGAFRSGGSGSSGPRMESRSRGMSMRSPGSSSSRSMRSGGSHGGGMRSGGMRSGGGGSRGGRGGGGRGR